MVAQKRLREGVVARRLPASSAPCRCLSCTPQNPSRGRSSGSAEAAPTGTRSGGATAVRSTGRSDRRGSSRTTTADSCVAVLLVPLPSLGGCKRSRGSRRSPLAISVRRLIGACSEGASTRSCLGAKPGRLGCRGGRRRRDARDRRGGGKARRWVWGLLLSQCGHRRDDLSGFWTRIPAQPRDQTAAELPGPEACSGPSLLPRPGG
jgi:hypothetical protein